MPPPARQLVGLNEPPPDELQLSVAFSTLFSLRPEQNRIVVEERDRASDVPLAESNDERAEEVIDDGGDGCPGLHACSFSDSVCSYSASARLSPGARSR